MPGIREKIQRRAQEVAQRRVRAVQSLGPLYATRHSIGQQRAPAESVIAVGEAWGERDAVYKLQFHVPIPPAWRGAPLALRIDLSEPPQTWQIATVEGLVSIDERTVQAVDRYHREVWLSDAEAQRETVTVMIDAWTGLDNPFHRLHALELRLMDRAADRLALQLDLLLDALSVISPDAPATVHLQNVLDQATDALDFRDGNESDAFYASCATASALIDTYLRSSGPAGAFGQPRVTAVGHAHIDVAWLWQLWHTRRKTADTFATALEHADHFPQFVFMHSTPQVYAWLKADHPDLYARIKAKVAQGQWEVEGATWVEMDTNLTGAESLVRQFLYGQRFFRQEFGRPSTVLWLPDVFGYSGALPQLMKGAGVDYFVTTKLSWNDTNRMPADTFWWEGLDGSRVLAYFITARNEATDTFATYNAEIKPSTFARAWHEYRNKDINDELLVAYGWGDGGGGPTRAMVAATEILAAPLSPDIPTVTTGTVAAFMERLAARVADNPHLPIWQGEMYFEYHRGTYTSQARTKRNHRHAERDLHTAEWLAVLARELTGQPYPQDRFDAIWPVVLTHQFHDILPGSSIGAVYADAATRYAEVREVTDAIINDALGAITAALPAPAGSLVVFNSTPWERPGLIELTAAETPHDLVQQAIADGRVLVAVPPIPPYGYRCLAPGDTSPIALSSDWVVSTSEMTTPYWHLAFNDKGQIVRLYDRMAEREVLAPEDVANAWQCFEDKPNNFDAWDIDAFYAHKQWTIEQLSEARVVESGPLRAAIEFVREYRGRTRIMQRIQVYAHTPRIDFVTTIDWHEHQTLLKVAFPVQIHSARSTAEVQFGTIERPTHSNTSWDAAKFETCAQKWVDLSEEGYGVALLNDCKYGHDVHGRVLRQTLLKSGVYPDPTADQGRHECTYSLLPHRGDWIAGGVREAAYDLNYPLQGRVTPSAGTGVAPSSFSLASTDQAHVIIETIKGAEAGDGWVIRLFEGTNRRGPFTVHLPFAARKITESNLLEEAILPIELARDRRSFSSTISPFQIRTFLVE